MLKKIVQLDRSVRRQLPSGAATDRLRALIRDWLARRPGGIRFKLAVVTLALIALITGGSSLVVIRTLDTTLLDSLVQRGGSLALAAATPAGFSLLSGDILALDNLAAKIASAQDEVLYLAILDADERVAAHSRLDTVGGRFTRRPGELVAVTGDYAVWQIERDNRSVFEVRAPVTFAEREVGAVMVGIDAAPYFAARVAARERVVAISLLALAIGLGGTLLLTARFTRPIKQLTAGVERISAGDYEAEVAIVSRDELGTLTENFNAMTRTIRAQQQGLQDSARELEEAYISTVRILAASLDARDNYTLNHSARVAALALRVGRRLDLSATDLRDLEIGCFLHDIGKIRVPDQVLNKPAPLDRDEAGLVRRHPVEGAEIIGLAPSLHRYVPVVRHHHEWYDGSGYPDGLQGEDIPLFARIVAISDAYDAMTTSRPYRPGRAPDAALEEIHDFRGRQFAPEIADLFITSMEEEPEPELAFLGAHLR